MQLLSNLAASGNDRPRVTVLYAAPSLDALQLVPELASAAAQSEKVGVSVWAESIGAYAGALSSLDGTVEARVKHGPASWLARPTARAIEVAGSTVPLHVGRISVQDIAALVPNSHDTLVLVCGPDGCVCTDQFCRYDCRPPWA